MRLLADPFANPFARPSGQAAPYASIVRAQPAPYAAIVGARAPELTSCPRVACPTLPSSETAWKVVQGDPWAAAYVARDLAVRTGICSLGIYLAGGRGWDVLKYGLGAASVIEVLAIGWVATQTKAR